MSTAYSQPDFKDAPERLTGLLVFFMLLAGLCVMPLDADSVKAYAFISLLHMGLCCIVWVHTALLLYYLFTPRRRRVLRNSLNLCQLILGVLCSGLMAGTLFHAINPQFFWLSLLLALIIGVLGVTDLGNYIRSRLPVASATHHRLWNSAVIFFVAMFSLVCISTVLLLSPGASVHPISFTDAFFMSVSAASNTGLCTVSVPKTFTWLGQTVLIVDMQIGTVSVMTFNYYVLLMVGQRLTAGDSISLSPNMDQGNVRNVPELIRSVIFVSLFVELVGAVCLYFCWKGDPGIPQDTASLIGYSLFHSISTFCNFGLTLFPDNFVTASIHDAYLVQTVMMVLIIAGTMGFGVYWEVITRARRRLHGQRNPLRWSTHSWFVLRVMLVVTVLGTIVLTLAGWLEPSGHEHSFFSSFWDGLWNSVGRSTGINRTDHAEYGPVYKLLMTLLMFIGGNPAGTGGGVFAPVFAICVLEVFRVLRGEQDLVIYNRCIAPSTVARAVSTLILGTMWVFGTSVALLLLEPAIASPKNGALDMIFLSVSAFSTAGHTLTSPGVLSDASKFLLAFSMMLGRVGMFTTILIFIRQRSAAPLRYPQTRLPLT